MTVKHEELTGYFNFEEDGYRQAYSDGGDTRHAYPCLVCGVLVLTIHSEQHVEWHKEVYKTNKEKTPIELRQEAKRELGRLRG